MRGVSAFVALLAVPLAGLVVSTFVVWQLTPSGAVGEAAEVAMTVDPASTSMRTPVRLHADFGPQRVLRMPSIDGVVTESFLGELPILSAGEPVLAVDGFVLVALASKRPMSGDLTVGAKGDDVEAVQSVLVKLGFLSAEAADGHFGRDTLLAARAFFKAMGGVILTPVTGVRFRRILGNGKTC